jgi:DNA repair protein RadD
MRVFSCTRPNMDGAKTNSAGEWSDSDAAARGMEIIGDVVSEWQRHASDRKTIVFGASLAHCEEITRRFNEAGIMTACFTSDTQPAEREALLAEYRKPDSAMRVLVSVEALAKGFDVPDVGCVCDCRPLRKSLSTAIQMWGRGLRSSPETGKTDCLLLDFSGNIVRFADDFSDIFYNGLRSLDVGEKLDKTVRHDDANDPDGKPCPVCGYKPCGRRCIACGHETVKPSMVIHEVGVMREIKIGQTVYAPDSRNLWEQACSYARSHSAPEKQEWRARLIYRDITGALPPRSWSVATTPNAVITKQVLNKIKFGLIAFANRRSA